MAARGPCRERAQADIADGNSAADIRTGARGRAIVRGGHAAARAAITTFAACLAWAKTRGLIDDNPAAGVRKIADVSSESASCQKRKRGCWRHSIHCRRAPASAQPSRDVISRAAADRRPQERNCRLTWDELDPERGVIRLRNLRSKTGDKVIVLNPGARDDPQRAPRIRDLCLPRHRRQHINRRLTAVVWVRAAAQLPGLRP
ncbi:MAG: hypothetical protein IPL62_00025 [Caulobacteraceae bacterium]|nr:hypothetical protein [Caulobacteraceae bacterium]